MRSVLALLPSLVPVFLASLPVAALMARPLARRFGSQASVAFLVVASLSLIVAATLTPGADEASMGAPGPGWCDLTRIGPAPLGILLRPNDVSLNVLLFVPLGLAIGLLPASPARLILLVGASALPFIVELTQSLATPLERRCESADIFDNLMGLAIGVTLGLGATWLSRRRPPAG